MVGAEKGSKQLHSFVSSFRLCTSRRAQRHDGPTRGSHKESTPARCTRMAGASAPAARWHHAPRLMLARVCRSLLAGTLAARRSPFPVPGRVRNEAPATRPLWCGQASQHKPPPTLMPARSPSPHLSSTHALPTLPRARTLKECLLHTAGRWTSCNAPRAATRQAKVAFPAKRAQRQLGTARPPAPCSPTI